MVTISSSYLWHGATLVFTGLACLGAYQISTSLSDPVMASASLSPSVAVAPASAPEPGYRIEELVNRHLFGQPVVATTTEPEITVDLSDAQVSSLPFRIDVIAHQPGKNKGFAILSHRDDSMVVAPGEEAFEMAMVVAIEPTAVVFERNGALERLEYQRKFAFSPTSDNAGQGTGANQVPAGQPVNTGSTNVAGRSEPAPMRQANSSTAVDSETQPSRLQSIDRQALQMTNGEEQSMKVTPDARSLLSIGLRPGDQILSIEHEGQELNMGMTQVMASLPPGSIVSAQIRRGPQTFYKTIFLQ